MKKLTLLLWLFVGLIAYPQQGQEKYHRAKIFYNSSLQFEQLEKAGIPTDHGIRKKDTYYESDFSESEIQRARAIGFTVEVVIEDLNAYYLNQNNPYHRDYVGPQRSRNNSCTNDNGNDYTTPANFNVFPANQFGGFYTYNQVLQELDDMVALYPNLISSPANISTFLTQGQPDNSTTPSIGGNPIKWLKISDNPNTDEAEPEILYTAIHHAREPASLSQLIFFMWYLLENYDTDPEVQSIVDNTELYFVPVINPDGYLYNELTNPQGGGFWRKNRKNGDGVDNNRNYDYHINGDSNNGSWGGPGSSSNPGSGTYHGTGPFSEKENQAMKWFVEQHNFVIALNNHTFGELIYYPFGYADVATPDEALYQAFTTELVSKNGYSPLRGSPFAGESDDFMYGTVGTHDKIFAMTPEIGTSFWPAQSAIESICKGMMYTNLTAAQMAGNFGVVSNASSAFVPNTSATAEYTLKRLGLEEPGNFNVTLNPLSSNIISVDSGNSHNSLSYAQVVNGSIGYDLDPLIAQGDEIQYELVLNNGLYNKVIPITKIFGQPTIALNEPANDISTNWTTTNWAITTEDFTSTPSSITDSPNSNYLNNANEIITLTNPLDLSGALIANLTFLAKWNVESNFDYVQLEVSTNGGSSWIPQCGLYTNLGVPNQNGANGEPLYDGIQNEWVNETIDLSDYIDQTILIRFKLISDVSVTEDGFYFDDLQVNILENNLSVDDFISNNFKVYPNPVNDVLNIISNIHDYTIKLYNLQGQLIYELRHQTNSSLIDSSNLNSGLYFMNIEAEGRSQSFKIIKD